MHSANMWRGNLRGILRGILFLLLINHSIQLTSGNEDAECGLSGGRRIQIAGTDGWLCNRATCKDRCETLTPFDEIHPCYCDEVCVRRSDCCFDYQAECVTKTNFTLSNLTAEYLLQYEVVRETECLATDYGISLPKATRCAKEFVGDREPCENGTYRNFSIDQYQNVFSKTTQTLYKNRYCAACNGVSSNDLIRLPILITCYETIIPLVQAYRSGSFAAFMPYFHKHCKQAPQTGLLPSLQRYRGCTVDGWAASDVCKVYHSPLYFAFDPTMYILRNSFCSYNFHNVLDEQICCVGRMDHKPQDDWGKLEPVFGKVHVVSDKKVLYDQRLLCVGQQVEDIISGTCIDKPCWSGETTLPDGSCLPHSIHSNRPTHLFDNHVQIVFKLKERISNRISSIPPELSKTLTDVFTTVGPHLQVEIQLMSCSLHGHVRNDSASDTEVCLLIEFIQAPTLKILQHVHQYTLKRKFLELVEGAFGEIENVDIQNYDENALGCQDGELIWINDGLLLIGAVLDIEFVEQSDVLSVHDQRGEVSYDMASVAVLLQWSVNTTVDVIFESKWRTGLRFAVCRKQVDLLSCPKVTFFKFSFDVLADRTIFYIDDNTTTVRVSLADDEFFMRRGVLVVCHASFESGQTVLLKSDETAVIAFYTLTGATVLTLMVTSVNLLMVHGKLYLAEKLAFHYSTRLLLAHVVSLISRPFVTSHTWCRVVACVQHLFLIAAFTAHAAFAVETACRFNAMCTMSSASGWSSRSKIYIEGTFFLAAAFVFLMNLEIFSGVVQYGSLYDGMSCWIKPFIAEIYLLAVPLAVVLAICLCYYISSLAMRLSPFCTVSFENSVYAQHRHLILASVKMSVLLLATWVCYFLREQHLSFLYLYYVGSCLQGLSCFVDFILH